VFGKLAQLTYHRRWYIIGTWLMILVVAAFFTLQVGSVLTADNSTQKGTDSERAAHLLHTQLHQNDKQVTLIVLHNPHLTIQDASFRQTVVGVAARVRADRGLQVSSLDNPLESGNRQLIARDQHSVALAVTSKLAESKIEKQIDSVRALVRTPGYASYVTGMAAMSYDGGKAVARDLAKNDMVVPIMLVILLLVFGTLVASAIPLVLAACSIVLSLALVFLIGHYLDTSVYVENVITFLGLGLGIDYSLFIVYRFREELARGAVVEMAVTRTMETTGRAIFFSGVTVAIGMSSLILTNISFMQSMGLGGMLVPLTSLLAAMTLLPALLSVLGTKVNRLRVLPQRFLRTGNGRVWHRLAFGIMRRPVLAGGVVLVLLAGLAYPVTRLNIADGGLKNAPNGQESVAGILYMQRHFPTVPDPIEVVVHYTGRGTLLQPSELAGMRAFEQSIRRDPETRNVIGAADLLPVDGLPSTAQLQRVMGRSLSQDEKTALISVIPRHDVGTKNTGDLVQRIRSMAASLTTPAGDPASGRPLQDAIYVGGAQASSTDFNDALYAHFPLIVGMVLVLTYAFLFYAFRSVFLPLKAVALNLLSVLAAYGMLELVFQGGIGASLLGFSPESGVAAWVPVFLFAFLFGLSMDYEVLLLSRIQEGWHATGQNPESVAFGLEKTGRLISSAAAIMVIAFSGFLLGSNVQLKEFGFGLVAAIALDATLIRLVLVPAIMRLMGTLNWWLPSALRGLAGQGATFGEGEPVSAFDEELELAS
jgi:RND superfamily putative drug exporter